MQLGMQYLRHVFCPLPPSGIVVFTQGKQQNSLECRKHRKFVNNWNFHSSSRKQRTLSVFPPLSIPSLSLYFSTFTPLSRTLSLCLFPSLLAIWARCNQRESSKKSWQQLITRQTQQKSKKPRESGSAKGCQKEGAVKRGIRQGGGLQQDLLPGEQAWMVFAPWQNAAASRTAQTNCSCRRLEGKRRYQAAGRSSSSR